MLNSTKGPMCLDDLERARAILDEVLETPREYFLVLNDSEANCFNKELGTRLKKGVNSLETVDKQK